MRNLMFIVLTLLLLVRCTTTPSKAENQKAIHHIRQSYVNGWLAGDPETVLDLFTKDAIIIPDGLEPIKGIEAIENYWFPNDSSVTTIHSYQVELLDMQFTDSMAYTLEKGALDFSYEKGDFSMRKTSASHSSTIYKKQSDGDWKMVSRMWSNINN